jgi:hypothetical protein
MATRVRIFPCGAAASVAFDIGAEAAANWKRLVAATLQKQALRVTSALAAIDLAGSTMNWRSTSRQTAPAAPVAECGGRLSRILARLGRSPLDINSNSGMKPVG